MSQLDQLDVPIIADKQDKLIHETMVRLLARREHSQFELLNKLLARGLDKALCMHRISVLAEAGLQSDRRFTQCMIRQRSGKGYGEMRIRAELKEHNINDNLADAELQLANINWLDVGARVLLKKFDDELAVDWSEKQKRKRFLHYRGFSSAQINDLIS